MSHVEKSQVRADGEAVVENGHSALNGWQVEMGGLKSARFLFYLEMANNHRNRIISTLAETLQRAGHEVLIACEPKIAFKFTAEGSIYVWDNLESINVHYQDELANCVRQVDVYSGESECGIEKAGVRRRHVLKEILEEFRPDRVCLWSGNFLYQQDTLVTLRQAGLQDRLFFMEVAWFPQQEHVYLDPKGVNARSSLRDGDYAPLLPHQTVRLDLWRDRYLTSRLGNHANGGRRKRIFVPLQVDTDTSIREGSPFPNMLAFVRFLERWVPNEYEVIFKSHPKAAYDYPLGSNRSNFYFRASGSIDDFISEAEIVLGINSTVLLEAVALGKKVIAFGEGLFSGCGVLTEASTESVPEDVFSQAVDQFARDRFLYHLIFERQISIAELKKGNVAHLFTREPFKEFPFPARFSNDVLHLNAKEAKSMIKIGKSKIARTASLDVEKGGQIAIGDDCEVRHHAVLEVSGRYNGSIEIGNHSVIGVGNWLQGSGKIRIGDDVIIGPYVAIVSTNHMYGDQRDW